MYRRDAGNFPIFPWNAFLKLSELLSRIPLGKSGWTNEVSAQNNEDECSHVP